MKKSLIIMFLFILVLSVFAADFSIDLNRAKTAPQITRNDDEKLSLTYTFDGIRSFDVETKAGLFTEIAIPNTYSTGELGMPKLPAAKKLIEIPFGAEVEVNVLNYSVAEYKLSEYGINNYLMPTQPSLPKSIDDISTVKFEYSETDYQQDRFSENEIASVEVLGVLRGIRLARLEIFPVSYNPVKGTIQVYNDVEIEVAFTGSDANLTEQIRTSTYSPYFEPIYNIILNSRVDHDYPAHPDLTTYPVKYLIVSDRMFESILADFIEWKTKKGFNVVEAYTDVIGSSASAIQTYVHDQYNAGTFEDPAPSFVLFVGDTNLIPASTVGSSSGKDTDLYYCSEDGDYFPEMFYGRMSARTLDHLQAQIDKILYYERYEFSDPTYLDDVTLIAGADGTWNTRVGQSTVQYGTQNYFNSTHGYDVINTYLTSYSGCYDTVNDGLGLINYSAHCNETSWDDPRLSQSTVNSFTNVGKYPLAIGNCCLAADFGYTECIAETWMRQENAGAVGYIGSSPSSYWFEDFYWSVGAFPISGTNDGYVPTYEETTWGAYDAGFMSDYVSQDALIFVGNLAVTEVDIQGYESHSSPLYYWQAYNTLGDPSLVIYNTQGENNSVSHLPTFPSGATTFEVTADAGSYVAISYVDVSGRVLLGSALVDLSGVVLVPIDPVVTFGTVDIVVTAPQCKPYVQNDVPVAALTGPYVSIDSYSIDADGDGIIEYGETVYLTVTLKNVGSDPATNVNMDLTQSDAYITLTDAAESFGTIAAGASVTRTSAYIFTVLNSVPDAHAFQLDGAITCTEDTWNDDMHFTAYAPDLSIQSVAVVDGGNGRLDPGETANLEVTIKNSGGAVTNNVNAILSNSDLYITISDNSDGIASLAAASTGVVTFTVTAPSSTPIGHTADFDVAMTADNGYSANDALSLTIGLILEDFESGSFTAFPWTNGGNENWSVVTESPYEGTYCAKSGTINHSQTSELILVADVITAGSIFFYRKVSSESSYDYLKFYINDVEQETWSGEVAWSEVSYSVAVGTDIEFKWQYMKDVSTDSGSDCAWVDYIIFPTINFPTPANITITPTFFEKMLRPDNTTSDMLEIGNTGEATLNYIANISYIERSTSTSKSKRSNSMSERSRDYCLSTYSNSGAGADDWIANVSFNTINNTSSYNDPDSYGDYTSVYTDVELGSTYPLCVTLGFEGTFYTQHVRVWIDWDQSEIFDADESFYLGTAPDDGTYQICDDILVPLTAVQGNTRMRIIEQYSSDPGAAGACDSHTTTWGETEDYTVIVGSGSSMSWLSLAGENYISGDVLGGDPDDVISVGFDATGLTEGEYQANITINSNDSDESSIIVPVIITVGEIVQPDNPINVNISISGTFLTLSWDSVHNASSYNVYSSYELGSGYTLEAGGILDTYWTTTILENLSKKFYQVTAVTAED